MKLRILFHRDFPRGYVTIPRGYVTIPLLRRRPPAQILRSGLAREIARSKAKSMTHSANQSHHVDRPT